MLNLKLKTLVELSKIQYPKPIKSWIISDLKQIESTLKNVDRLTFHEYKPMLDEVRIKLENLISQRFFEELSLGDEHFIFPYLDINDFKNTGLEYSKFDLENEKNIQKARAKYNNALKRICSKIGIEPISSHTPRHTIARHLIKSGRDIYTIQGMLGHKKVATTEVYIKSRHPLIKRIEEMRKINYEMET
jgi:integrase